MRAKRRCVGMIINEEKIHGAAMLRLVTQVGELLPDVSVSIGTGNSRSAYLLRAVSIVTGSELTVGLFVKISNARRSPWRYSFLAEHQLEVETLKRSYGEVFSIFGAGDDGFACLNYSELKEVLDEEYEDVEWVSVSRKIHQNYRVSGKDGRRERPLPRNSYPGKVVAYLEQRLLQNV